MERRITLNDNTMKKKNGNNSFENGINEKQNSLSSGIRIDFDGNFSIIKQKFIKIKEAEYSTDFDFFIQNQVHIEKSKTMKIADLNKDWKQDITFKYKQGLIEYQCQVKYLPFCNSNRMILKK